MKAADCDPVRNGSFVTDLEAGKAPHGVNITINHFYAPADTARTVAPSCSRASFDQVIDEVVADIAREQETRTAPPAAPGQLRMIMTRATHEEILVALGSRPPESGGILLGPRNHSMVTHFLFDQSAKVTASSYTPDRERLNTYLKGAREFGLDMKGIVHSHPAGVPYPSPPDLEHVLNTFSNPRNSAVSEYLLPIVCEGKFYPYVFTRELLEHCRKQPGTLRRGTLAAVVLV